MTCKSDGKMGTLNLASPKMMVDLVEAAKHEVKNEVLSK